MWAFCCFVLWIVQIHCYSLFMCCHSCPLSFRVTIEELTNLYQLMKVRIFQKKINYCLNVQPLRKTQWSNQLQLVRGQKNKLSLWSLSLKLSDNTALSQLGTPGATPIHVYRNIILTKGDQYSCTSSLHDADIDQYVLRSIEQTPNSKRLWLIS